MNALARLGMVSESPSENQTTNTVTVNTVTLEPAAKDYFVEHGGVKFAGMHLLIDLWGASNGARAAGATILHSHFHHFTPNGGVSGVVVLAESHISIHTWPERGFAAVDVFMCGCCDPHQVIPFLRTAFTPSSVDVSDLKRGIVS